MSSVSFGLWLKHQRVRLGMTQQAFGNYVGCSGETVRKIERDRFRPSLQFIEHIMRVLEAPAGARSSLIQWARTGNRPSTLPTPLTPLFGRDQDIANVCGLLQSEEVRLLTLTGAPGVGKTRLALAVATTLEQRMVDRIVYIPLATILTPTMLFPTIAYNLGITETNHKSLFDQVVEQLRAHPCLLILDNLEHLLDAVAILSDMLIAIPRITILTTSRAILRLSGEYTYIVPPLQLPVSVNSPVVEDVVESPAVRLFVQMVENRMPNQNWTPAKLKPVISICHRLDGLPLAIELAAARIPVVSLPQLLQQLDERFLFLTEGTRDVPQHQHTLWATLDWSYRLLSPMAQTVFRCVGMFVGGCTLEAITAIYTKRGYDYDYADSDDVTLVNVLSTLIDHSLLQRVTDDMSHSPRYQMLETVREFALSQLIKYGEYNAVQQCYVSYFLELAEMASPHLHSEKQQEWLQRLQVEHDNFNAALDRALNQKDFSTAIRLGGILWPFWYMKGYVSEGGRWLDMILDRNRDIRSSGYAQVLAGAGWFALMRGNYQGAYDYYTRCLDIAMAYNDQPLIANTLGNLGIVMCHQGNYGKAQDYFEQGVVIHRELKRYSGLVYALISLAEIKIDLGDYAEAVAILEENLQLARSVRNHHVEAMTLNNLSYAYAMCKLYQKAIQACEESLCYRRANNNRLGIASSLRTRGRIARLQGDVDYSIVCLREGLQQFRVLDVTLNCVECIEDIAEALVQRGQMLHAAQLWGATESLREHLGSPLAPGKSAQLREGIALAQASSDPASWQATWDKGRTLSLQQAIDLALDEPIGDTSAKSIAPQLSITKESNTGYALSLQLTKRETEVVCLVAQGLADQAIANQLAIHQGTVRVHIHRVFHKVGVSTRSELTTWATQYFSKLF